MFDVLRGRMLWSHIPPSLFGYGRLHFIFNIKCSIKHMPCVVTRHKSNYHMGWPSIHGWTKWFHNLGGLTNMRCDDPGKRPTPTSFGPSSVNEQLESILDSWVWFYPRRDFISQTITGQVCFSPLAQFYLLTLFNLLFGPVFERNVLSFTKRLNVFLDLSNVNVYKMSKSYRLSTKFV